MRIAIISEAYLPELSGVTTSLHERARQLGRMGHQVRIYAPDYSIRSQLYPNYRSFVGKILPGVEVVPFESKPYIVDYTLEARPFSFGKVAEDIRSFQPDVIHTECPERLFMGFYTRPGIRLAEALGIPATAIYHTNYLAYIEDFKQQAPWLRLPGMAEALRRLMIWVYNGYDLTLVPTPITHRYLVEQGIKNTRLGLFYGVDTQYFRPKNGESMPAAYQPFQDQVRILYVGRLTPDKRVDVLMQAFDVLKKEHANCCLVMIGGATQARHIGKWAVMRADVLVPLGLAPEELHPYYAHADIFVTASPKENRPLTVLEAMSSRLPVVGPQAGGLIDLVNPGRTGLLFQPDQPQALASALGKLAAAPDVRRQFGENARQEVERQSWENAAQEMLLVWEEVRKRQRLRERQHKGKNGR